MQSTLSNRLARFAGVLRALLIGFGALVAGLSPLHGEQPPSGSTRFGKVVDQQTGQPIAGATVEWLEASFEALEGSLPAAAASAQTATDGTYQIAVSDSTDAPIGTLRVHAPGYETLLRIEMQEPPDPGVESNFELRKGGRITGRVMDSLSQPLAGAHVGRSVMQSPQDANTTNSPDPKFMEFVSSATVTDAQGNFVLEGLTAGRSYRIPVNADGHFPKLTEETPVGTEGLVVILESGASAVFGKVLDARGNPVAGATVRLVPRHDSGEQALAARTSLKTGPDGAYRFASVPPGEHSIIATNKGESDDASTLITKEIIIGNNQNRELNITLPDEVTVSGIARTVDGQPLAGVIISDRARGSGPSIATGPDGRFSISLPRMQFFEKHGAPSVNFHVYAPDGWVLAEPDAMGDSISLNDLLPSVTTAQRDILFKKGVNVTIQVVSAEGQPVPGASVLVGDDGTRTVGMMGFGALQTGGDGKVQVTIASNGVTNIAASHASGHAELDLDDSSIPEDGVVTLKLGKVGTVSGFVRDESGAPKAGVHISLSNSFEADSPMYHGMGMTNQQGFYEISGVPPGKYEVLLILNRSNMERIPVEIAAGESKDNVNFVYAVGVELAGVVKDESGLVVKGVKVSVDAMMPSFIDPVAETDKDGRFVLKGLAKGKPVEYLRFTHEEYEDTLFEAIAQNEFPLEVTMVKAKTLVLHAINDKTGEPVKKFRYRVERDEFLWGDENPLLDKIFTAETEDGRIEVKGMPVGEFSVGAREVLEGEGAVPLAGSSSFKVVAGNSSSLEVEIRMKGGIRIAGVVRHGAGGPPVEGATVSWGNGDKALKAVTDAEGNFTMENAPRNVGQLSAEKDDLRTSVASNYDFLSTDPPESIEIIVGRAAAVKVRVLGKTGKPLSGQEIALLGDTVGMLEAKSDNDGNHQWTNIAPGEYEVILMPDRGRMPQRREVVVEPGKDLEVVFDLSAE